MRSSKLREPGYRGFLLHRLSGLALALFLPLHFLTLALAIEGESKLQDALEWFQQPAVKLAEWLLVVFLAMHLVLGTRLLLIEFASRYSARLGWIPLGLGGSALFGLLFIALAL